MMNQTQVLIACVLGLSIAGTVGLSGAIASAQDSPPYNCRTREVWSPDKQRWCAAQMQAEASDDAPVMSIEALVGTEWQLTRLNKTPVPDAIQMTLTVESRDRLVGHGGCNRYFADITADGDALTVAEIGSTLIGCEPALMEQEAQFFAALQTATRFEQRGNILRIYSANLEKPLRFTRTSIPNSDLNAMIDALIETEWQLAELNGRPVSNAIQTTLTIESRDRLSGKGGCNGYVVPMQVNGSNLTLEPIRATMAMCEPTVMEQESQFFEVLQAATRFETDGTSLLIYSAASNSPLRFSQMAAAETNLNTLVDTLIGTEWLLEDLSGTGVLDTVQTTLTFIRDSAETGISGSGGCNQYFGGLTVDGDRISIGTIGATRMGCIPPVMDQESRFFQALEGATHLELDGPYLLIHSEGTVQPLRLTRITPLVNAP